MNNSALFSEVKKLIALHALCQPGEISGETRLVEDLRIVGDDVEELLREFKAEFSVDLSNLDFCCYFPEEATANMHYCLATIAKRQARNTISAAIYGAEAAFWRCFASQLTFKTITIEQLVKSAEAGKWTDA